MKMILLSPCIALFFCLSLTASELVTVPAGQVEAIWLSPLSFKKNQSKKDTRWISVLSFKAQAYPVTQGQFKKFLSDSDKWKKDQVSRLFADENYLKNIDFSETHKDVPMTEVSWFAAKAYCEHLGMRLPTVVEWEYMSSASEKKQHASRDPAFLKRILDWYGEPQNGNLKKVGSIYKNYYGIWDIHGLIWEWVDDFNSSFVTGESREDGSLNKDMFCGSGNMSVSDKENYAAFMRFAFRSSLKGTSTVWNLGFRCVQ